MPRKKRTKKSLSAKICIAVFTLYLVVCLVNLQVSISEKRAEYEQIEFKISQQYSENKNLERILNSDNDDEYIEKIAREKLGFAYPDEKIYIDISGN